MATVDEVVLSQKYNLVKVSIAGSTQISSQTSKIITKLTNPSPGDQQAIIVLTAHSRYANKLISIVEISKRELAGGNVPVFQYNALSSMLTEIERKSENANNGAGIESIVNDDGSDDAFEGTEVRSPNGPKKRAVPVMTTYLSSASIKDLKTTLGEQR